MSETQHARQRPCSDSECDIEFLRLVQVMLNHDQRLVNCGWRRDRSSQGHIGIGVLSIDVVALLTFQDTHDSALVLNAVIVSRSQPVPSCSSKD